MQIVEALEDYLLQLEADGRSRHTVNQYRRHIGLLGSWLGEKRLEEVGHRDLAQFLTSDVVRFRSDGRPRMPTSANTIRSSLRVFFGYLHTAGYLSRNPAGLIRRARCSSGPPRALSKAEQERLLAALDQAETEAERRDRMLFRLLLGCGARLGEILEVRVEDISLEGMELRLRKQKGGGEGVVHLPAQVVELLAEYLGDRRSGWLFPGQGSRPVGSRQAHRRLSMWLERAEIRRPASPHSLRHSYATDLYRRTGDLLLVRDALRHRSITSTTIYAHASDGRLREALRG